MDFTVSPDLREKLIERKNLSEYVDLAKENEQNFRIWMW